MDIKYFVIGAVGGLAPEIVRLYEIARQGGQFRISTFYVVMSLIFAALAGLVALLLPSTNALGAFYAGISTPVLINTALKKGRAAVQRRKATKSGAGAMPRSRFDGFIDAL